MRVPSEGGSHAGIKMSSHSRVTNGGGSHGDLLIGSGLLAYITQIAVVRGERSENGGTLLERQSFSAHGGLDPGVVERGAQRGLRVLGPEIVPQGFAFLSERKLQKIEEAFFGDLQMFDLGSEGEPDHSRVYFGWWRKRSGRYFEQFLDFRIELRSGS